MLMNPLPGLSRKDETKAPDLDQVLLNLAEILRAVAVMVYPFMPSTALTMLERLSLPQGGENTAPGTTRSI